MQEIEINEKHRCQLQSMIDEAINSKGNKTYLHILSQYRLLVSWHIQNIISDPYSQLEFNSTFFIINTMQGMANAELQFEMAIRDQVIHNQKEAQRNMWNMLMGLGLDQKCLMDLAAKEGITIEDSTTPLIKGSPFLHHTTSSPYSSCAQYPGIDGQPYASQACVLQHHQDFSTTAYYKGRYNSHGLCRQEHHSSYYLFSHDHSPYSEMRHQASGSPSSCFFTPIKLTRDKCGFYPESRTPPCPHTKESITSSLNEGFKQLQEVKSCNCEFFVV